MYIHHCLTENQKEKVGPNNRQKEAAFGIKSPADYVTHLLVCYYLAFVTDNSKNIALECDI